MSRPFSISRFTKQYNWTSPLIDACASHCPNFGALGVSNAMTENVAFDFKFSYELSPSVVFAPTHTSMMESPVLPYDSEITSPSKKWKQNKQAETSFEWTPQ